ncbi:proline racemase family protein [Actinomadura madurae]|uniref:proline racemase family protein n=1 Tax=Actinomadura madurae TaxID=1993 RepID=UPI0020D231E6|nr:proline racemase family protein [Actinomadura madurae]MCP9964261.1 proline racemase family protein [Actinomadura madurae]MCP9976741.1 proline racemase family protein [Actinomadura madurae]MCQ0012924.1 proline racemase family protein [Actinomadura madurae]
MRSARSISAVDSHTEGMPTRVVTGGVAPIPGATMAERRRYAVRHLDGLRRFLVDEPRGHPAMSGALLQPPTRPDADWGVVYIEVSGFLPMCGHGTIGVATVLVETGMVEVAEPETVVRLDTPAGLVEARVAVRDGAAEHVTLRNIASFALRRDAVVTVPGLGDVRYDMAYGGNFYAITDLEPLGLPFDRARKDDILAAGLAVMAAIDETDPPVHPGDPLIAGCKHVQFLAPGSDAKHSRNAMAIHPGWFDRSPCGTGTSARMAQLHARGELPLHTEFVNESFIGTRFTGRLVGTADAGGLPAVIPEFTGRAWITGTATYLLDPDDPFPEGFVL